MGFFQLEEVELTETLQFLMIVWDRKDSWSSDHSISKLFNKMQWNTICSKMEDLKQLKYFCF